jgi:hypothetical protein
LPRCKLYGEFGLDRRMPTLGVQVRRTFITRHGIDFVGALHITTCCACVRLLALSALRRLVVRLEVQW